jgi:hypothetical protein
VETVGKKLRARERPNLAVPRIPDLRLPESDQHNKWIPEENKMLQRLHKQCGSDWTEISKEMEAEGYYRDAKQCRKQATVLDPNISYNQWSTREDQTLQELHEGLGPKWARISKRMKMKGYHRSNRQCKGRMKVLSVRVRIGA